MAFYTGWENAARELHHVVLFHQSEWESVHSIPRLIMPDHGALMPAVGAHTWDPLHFPEQPERRPDAGLRPVPFRDEIFGTNLVTQRAQTLVSGFTAQWKAQLAARVPDVVPSKINPLVIVSLVGRGSSQLRELTKKNDRANPLNSDTIYAGSPDEEYRTLEAVGGHYLTAVDDVRRLSAFAAEQGLVYRLIFVGLMQGLSNEAKVIVRRPDGPVTIDGNAETQPLSEEKFISYYSADVVDLLTDFRADTAPWRGDFPAPPLLVMIPNVWHVAEAVRQAAVANDNIHIVGPTYHLPSAIDGEWEAYGRVRHGTYSHLAPDSQNVIGEMLAKTAARVLFDEPADALTIRHAWMGADDREVFVRLNILHPPVRLDETFIARNARCGFEVTEADLSNGIEAQSVEVAGDDLLRVRFMEALPADNRRLRLGWYSDVDTLSPVKSVSTEVPAFANGAPATEIKLTGDQTAKIARLLDEGSFPLCVPSRSRRSLQNSGFSVAVRGHYLDAGDSVLRVETAELDTSSQTFEVGDVPFCGRGRGFTNVRDSDPTRSVYRWSDRMPAKRAGKRYPLHNWLMLTSHITILEDEPA